VGDASFAAWTRGFDDPSAAASEEALLPPYLSDMSLIEVAERYGTPLYVYNFDAVAKQVRVRSSIRRAAGHGTTLLSRTIASDPPIFASPQPTSTLHCRSTRYGERFHVPRCHSLCVTQ
jgi:hypothetical protein